MTALIVVVCLIASYLIGSIPTSYIFVRIRTGQDIRQVGSGNVGATNAGRLLGKPYFFIIFFLDVAKGIVAAVLGTLWIASPWGAVGCGLLSIVGHIFPLWLNFRGGKAVATSCGVFAWLSPLGTLAALLGFAVGRYSTGYVSVGSLAAAVVLPVCTWITYRYPIAPSWLAPEEPAVYLSIVVGILVFITHRSNIHRLIRGEEHKSTRKDDGAA